MTNLQFAHMLDADAIKDLNHVAIDFSLAGDNVLISGIAKQKIYVYRIFLTVENTTNLTFKNGVSIDLTGAMPFYPYGTLIMDISNSPWFQTSDGNDFILNTSDSGQISGAVYYQQY
jgi:hypothetical protein